MTYNISLDEEYADVLQELDIEELSTVLNDEEKLQSFKYALLQFQSAYNEAIENDDYSLSMKEREQSYLHNIDGCN